MAYYCYDSAEELVSYFMVTIDFSINAEIYRPISCIAIVDYERFI